MIKKKSLISLVLAICLIVPAMFMLTACSGKTKATVSADEWASAFALEGQDNYFIEVKSSANPDYLIVMQRQGAKLYLKRVGDVDSGSDVQLEYYYDRVGDVCKEYEYNKTDSKWEAESCSVEGYNSMLNAVMEEISVLNDYESFKYNKETKAYEAKSVTKGDITVTNAVVKFADGLITKVEFAYEEVIFSLVFTYGSVQVAIPSIL